MTRIRAGRFGVCIPAGAINVFPLQNGQTGCGGRSDSLFIGYRGSFPEVKSPGRVGASGAEVMSVRELL